MRVWEQVRGALGWALVLVEVALELEAKVLAAVEQVLEVSAQVVERARVVSVLAARSRVLERAVEAMAQGELARVAALRVGSVGAEALEAEALAWGQALALAPAWVSVQEWAQEQERGLARVRVLAQPPLLRPQESALRARESVCRWQLLPRWALELARRLRGFFCEKL